MESISTQLKSGANRLIIAFIVKSGKMKKNIFILTSVFISLLLICCEKTDVMENEKEIAFLRTDLGGCHDLDSDAQKSAATEQKDTVIFTAYNDTLDVFVGLNYICCAPFTSDVIIFRDTLFMTLTDTCNFPEETCYCKCMCYYTWNFIFADFGQKEYYYKIILHNPREDLPVVFGEGSITL